MGTCVEGQGGAVRCRRYICFTYYKDRLGVPTIPSLLGMPDGGRKPGCQTRGKKALFGTIRAREACFKPPGRPITDNGHQLYVLSAGA